MKAELIEPCHELSEKMIVDCWWTPEELQENGLERKEVIEIYHIRMQQIKEDNKEGKHEVDTGFNDFLKSCSSSLSFSQVMRTKATNELLFAISKVQGLRGLEPKLFPIRQLRKLHIHTLICTQTAGGGGALDEELLSATSQQSSRASQILARVFAQLDMREARSCWR
jgi:hypothetical protein